MPTLMTVLLCILGASAVGALLWLRRSPGKAETAPQAQAEATPRVRTAIQSFSANAGQAEAEAETAADASPVLPTALQSFVLLRTDTADTPTPQTLLELADALPEPHSMFLQVTRELDDIDEITAAVKNEPALAADVLRTVNSAAFGLTTPISSVHHAIAYLGVSYVKGLIAQSALARTLPASTPGSDQETAMHRLWKSSQIASASAFLLARNLGVENPSVVSTQALLANLGDINLVSLRPELAHLYAPKVSLLERVQGQQAELGANSAMLAGLLAERWGLPGTIKGTLDLSLLPLTVPPDEHPLHGGDLAAATVVYLAGRIGDAAVFGGLQDIVDLPLDDGRPVELHYLPEYLEAAALQRLHASLQDNATRRALNRILAAARS
ncbi:HDOD domain-containing protein [Haliea sp.]|uniref:HDOD domain-containing protein n=1 Tax=Haliea sp. TaxID=1932666 RepID=UPI00352724C2